MRTLTQRLREYYADTVEDEGLESVVETLIRESVDEIERLAHELEVERCRLAGCGVAAMSNTTRTIAQRIDRNSPYYSASYGDVCAAVDREVRFRGALEAIASGEAGPRQIAGWALAQELTP